MNRRSFLKLTVPALVALTIPFKWTSESKWKDFDPSYEYGIAIPLPNKYKINNLPNIVLDILHQNAKEILPSNILYEIRVSIPEVYYRVPRKIAWYYHPGMRSRDLHSMDSCPHICWNEGYVFISKHYT